MSKLPRHPVSNVAHDESEAPTLKWNRPAELAASPALARETGKVRRFESAPVRITEAPKSGTRAAMTPEELERWEMREKRETLPAPPDEPDSGES